MTIDEIRKRAQLLGLNLPARMKKGDLIRAIQRAEGYQDCFGAAWRNDCPWTDCCWRSDCRAHAAG